VKTSKNFNEWIKNKENYPKGEWAEDGDGYEFYMSRNIYGGEVWCSQMSTSEYVFLMVEYLAKRGKSYRLLAAIVKLLEFLIKIDEKRKDAGGFTE
jgi:hypothetical protein